MKWRASQKGATILELTIGLSIAAMLGMGVVGLIDHEFKSTGATRACVTISHEIKNAIRWISQDVMMAESTSLMGETPAEDYLALAWVERYDFLNIPHSCKYHLYDTDLCREYDGTVTTVARHISAITFSQDNDLLTVSISCTPPWIGQNRTEDKTYRIYLRSAN
jgi:type II secretory pathway component PulJ